MIPSKSTIAIIAITILAALAIFKGINGIVLVGAMSAITGLGGYALGRAKKP